MSPVSALIFDTSDCAIPDARHGNNLVPNWILITKCVKYNRSFTSTEFSFAAVKADRC